MRLNGLDQLDRFLQWDLVTLNPWRTPVWAAVGARLLPDTAEIWTSTTVGFTSKVRNLTIHPRVAIMRWAPPEPAVVIRGEASVVSGDGTENLAQLFRLMGGPGAQREFFGVSSEHPLWRRLYGEYWRRVLIRIRVVEVWRQGEEGWLSTRHGPFHGPRERPAPTPVGPPSRRAASGRLETPGLQMVADGMPAALAVFDPRSGAPLALPTEARLVAGRIEVRPPASIPTRLHRRSSLVVRVVDDSYEMARMVGWIGTLEPGSGWRQFLPRSVYGFVKPPGLVPDVAAGLAAAVAAAGDRSEVSRPRVRHSAQLAGGKTVPRLRLSARAWAALERLFSEAAAAAPMLSAAAAISPDPAARAQLALLAQRATMERDFAHSLLLRGHRPVPPLRLAGIALAARPRGTRALAEALRRDRDRERWRAQLRSELPPLLTFGLPAREASDNAAAPESRSLVGAAALSAAESVVAVADRLLARLGGPR